MIYAVTLSDFARSYVGSHSLSVDYAKRLQKRAVALENHAGEKLIATVLAEPLVNAFLESIEAKSPRTVRSYREDLLTLWNAAADDDLVPYPVTRRIRLQRLPALLIECYSVDEIRSLLKTAERLTGCYPNGVARSLYWTATIRVGWDSGFRRGDIWRLRRDNIQPDGLARIVQRKTGQIAMAVLCRQTVEAIATIDRPTPMEWSLGACYFGRHFKRLVKASGVNRGSFKWLRRSSGSYVEAQQPGAGHKHLGHATAAIFSRHYDAKLGGCSLPLPPAL